MQNSSADSPGVAAVIKHLAMLYKKQVRADSLHCLCGFPLFLSFVKIVVFGLLDMPGTF